MNDKINKIYLFLNLEENRKFNRELQNSFYKSVFLPYTNIEDKVISLLYHVANTQSQPKINELASFFEHVISRKDRLSTFEGLIDVLKESSSHNSKDQTLFNLLDGQKGWGPKTAALFAKCIFQIHSNNYYEFNLWHEFDLNKFIEKNGIMLPVDSVIKFIFDQLKLEIGFKKAVNFESINNFLRDDFTYSNFEVWDDLWFWGYFTQYIEKESKERVFKWNVEKYWVNPFTNKNPAIVNTIEEKANEFIELIKRK